MTSRRPTIATRLAVLERLAEANQDKACSPDSAEFTSVDWEELERDSFLDGVEDLLVYQEERVADEEQRQIEETRMQQLHRARQRAQARRWEQEQIERARTERLERRLEKAKAEAAEEAADKMEDRRAKLDLHLETRAAEQKLEREITRVEVTQSRRRWGAAFRSVLAVAALAGVVGTAAFTHSQNRVGQETAGLWEEAVDHEMAAYTRVAELEAEIERHVNMSASERKILEADLQEAQQELAAAEKAREEVDRKRPRSSNPQRLATLPTKTSTPHKTKVPTKTTASTDSVRVAADEHAQDGCLPFDPLCFDL